MRSYTVSIVGSRSFTDYNQFVRCMESIMGSYGIQWGLDWDRDEDRQRVLIVSGGAHGADAMAERYAFDCGFKFMSILAEWDVYGKSAGMRRNTQIVECADLVVAFWDGESRGTADSIEKAQIMGKDLKVIFVEDDSWQFDAPSVV
jgi:hypothetical protein